MGSQIPQSTAPNMAQTVVDMDLVAIPRVELDNCTGLLFDAAKQFTYYAHLHVQKGTEDGIKKGLVNLKLAGELLQQLQKMDVAVAEVKPEVNG